MKQMDINLFSKELKRIEESTIKSIEKAINEVAEDLLSASQRLAPLKEGGLMESGTVEPAKKEGSQIVAKVGYKKKYTLIRHESFYKLGETSQKKSGFDGMTVGRKFLGQPMTQYRGKYTKHIGEAMKKGLGQ